MKQDTQRKITVEDLLRLKKAERPPAAFWATFETELRTKQLSAIVGKKPWWNRIPSFLAVVNRHQLSFGTAAALAMAFAGFRYVSGQPPAVRATHVSAPPSATIAVIEAVPAPVAPLVVNASALREEAAVPPAPSAPVPQAVAMAPASHFAPPAVTMASDAMAKAPFIDGIAIKLADFREPVSEYSRPSAFGSDREFEPAAAPAHQAMSEPLARIDPAAERRARLLAPALPAFASGNSSALSGDWMRQRASSDERMYESMNRGSSDDRMLVGFRF